MSITIANDKTLQLVELTREGDSADLLKSYVQLHNETLKTMEWMKAKGFLSNRSWDWTNTLEGLEKISRALDAGYDPFTPPPTWSSGPIATYVGPIPEAVWPLVEKAKPIFGADFITVHDPRPDRFQRAIDPIITGDIVFQNKRQCFLVAQWDLDQDIKYLSDGAEQLGSLHDQIVAGLRQANEPWASS